jgi:hypothetical protein
MWFREYKDYKIDAPTKKERVSPSKGIVGCEMHELNGWGEEYEKPLRKKKGFFERLFLRLKGKL